MPETNIDFQHLIQDIVQAYPYEVDEAVLVELIANSLDAGCTEISVRISAPEGEFEIVDNGRGMISEEFVHYHDLAITTKQRGRGIGFAGLGAKLGVYLAGEVVTETRSARYWGSSLWRSRGRQLPWWDYTALRTLPRTGTRVVLRPLPSSPLLDVQRVRQLVVLHYGPLLDPYLSGIYQKAKVYPHGVRFRINEQLLGFEPIVPNTLERNRHEFALTRGRRRQPIGIGYFVLSSREIPEELQGIAVCTFGKVIKRDWFRKYPKDNERITGFVEVPSLVDALNTTKSDFLKSGAEGQRFYQFYREMQRELGEWLGRIGQLVAHPEPTREAERLEKLVREILQEIPELQTLFATPDRRPVVLPDPAGDPAVIAEGGAQKVRGTVGGSGGGGAVPVAPGPEHAEFPIVDGEGEITAARRPRSVRFGPHVVWAEGGNERPLGWVDADNIVINKTHPAFLKAERSGMKVYHDLLSIIYAMLEHQGEGENQLPLLNRFMATWGRI